VLVFYRQSPAFLKTYFFSRKKRNTAFRERSGTGSGMNEAHLYNGAVSGSYFDSGSGDAGSSPAFHLAR
jgi:hypothetical protein